MLLFLLYPIMWFGRTLLPSCITLVPKNLFEMIRFFSVRGMIKQWIQRYYELRYYEIIKAFLKQAINRTENQKIPNNIYFHLTTKGFFLNTNGTVIVTETPTLIVCSLTLCMCCCNKRNIIKLHDPNQIQLNKDDSYAMRSISIVRSIESPILMILCWNFETHKSWVNRRWWSTIIFMIVGSILKQKTV